MGIFWIFLIIGLYYFSITLWSKGILTAGWFVLIQLYMMNIFSKVWDFGKNMQRLYESLADAEEMTVIFNTPHEIQDVPRAKKLVVKKGKIVFKDVGFNYHATRAVLKKFNLEIAPKENIALVGASGSGKTTIVKLILRMNELTSGHIYIDGQDIARVTQESLWKNISMVPQDPILFHRSLMENIRYGKADATDEDVMEAARLARCHEFIMETDQGYDTFVGERGIKLSGGERQRIAIARAILRNSKILVLDEATSSLDSNSESLIQEALAELMKDKTVIVVAHRLSTIRRMDRIIVIDQGEIIETGKHDELAEKKDGAYAKLWQLQAGGFIAK
jgi:ATP-binding cassette subfamily B protein